MKARDSVRPITKSNRRGREKRRTAGVEGVASIAGFGVAALKGAACGVFPVVGSGTGRGGERRRAAGFEGVARIAGFGVAALKGAACGVSPVVGSGSGGDAASSA